MPSTGANQAAWTVLDTDFQEGQHFLSTWLKWQRDPLRSRMLHYVGIAPVAPDLSRFTRAQTSSELPTGCSAFIEACKCLDPGFHRMLLDEGQVSLTLCIGDVQSLLGEHVFQADTAFATTPLDKWAAQRLARRCKRGTQLFMHPDLHAMALMQAAGFLMDVPTPGQNSVNGTFNPRWNIPTRRTTTQHIAQRTARCAVVGAGIAGASIAHALAVRGWDVTVFDTAQQPAGGASGLPAALAVPHVSADDNPRARLSRSGCSLLAQHAARLLVRGEDWDPCGVSEHRPDDSKLWHATACWIKPAKLVHAWLAHPGIRFIGNRTVTQLNYAEGQWSLHGPLGQGLGQFEVVVLANAMGCRALLGPHEQQTLAALQAVHGTLSYGGYKQAIPGLPATPMNGYGSFIPHVPGDAGEQWFAGATFETDTQLATNSAEQHTANMARLGQLLPRDGVDYVTLLERAPVGQWTSTRCVTHDRLPLVGPVDSERAAGLWLCVGMGSRGLSFSALCAELLVARLGGEPLPIALSLSRSLDVSRVRRRSAGKTGD